MVFILSGSLGLWEHEVTISFSSRLIEVED